MKKIIFFAFKKVMRILKVTFYFECNEHSKITSVNRETALPMYSEQKRTIIIIA